MTQQHTTLVPQEIVPVCTDNLLRPFVSRVEEWSQHPGKNETLVVVGGNWLLNWLLTKAASKPSPDQIAAERAICYLLSNGAHLCNNLLHCDPSRELHAHIFGPSNHSSMPSVPTCRSKCLVLTKLTANCFCASERQFLTRMSAVTLNPNSNPKYQECRVQEPLRLPSCGWTEPSPGCCGWLLRARMQRRWQSSCTRRQTSCLFP